MTFKEFKAEAKEFVKSEWSKGYFTGIAIGAVGGIIGICATSIMITKGMNANHIPLPRGTGATGTGWTFGELGKFGEAAVSTGLVNPDTVVDAMSMVAKLNDK